MTWEFRNGLFLPPGHPKPRYSMGGSFGPWVLERPDTRNELYKLQVIFSPLSALDPLTDHRAIMTGLSEGPRLPTWKEVRESPYFKVVVSMAAVNMMFPRVERIHRKRSEALGKLIWLGLKWIGVV